MRRYHFNVYNGTISLDLVGTELPDIHAARREALRIAISAVDDAARRPKIGTEWAGGSHGPRRSTVVPFRPYHARIASCTPSGGLGELAIKYRRSPCELMPEAPIYVSPTLMQNQAGG